MLRWMMIGALGGLVGGGFAELFEGMLDGAVTPEQIGLEAVLWGSSLSLAAGAAYWPSYWVTRGIVGGITYGLVRGGLTAALALPTSEWAVVMGSEMTGGVMGGLMLAYLWRPGREEGGAEPAS